MDEKQHAKQPVLVGTSKKDPDQNNLIKLA